MTALNGLTDDQYQEIKTFATACAKRFGCPPGDVEDVVSRAILLIAEGKDTRPIGNQPSALRTCRVRRATVHAMRKLFGKTGGAVDRLKKRMVPLKTQDAVSFIDPMERLAQIEEAENALAKLTPREQTIAKRMAAGASLKQIGRELGLTLQRVQQIVTAWRKRLADNVRKTR